MKQDRMKGLFREQGGTLQSLLKLEAELSSRQASMAGMQLETPKNNKEKRNFPCRDGS